MNSTTKSLNLKDLTFLDLDIFNLAMTKYKLSYHNLSKFANKAISRTTLSNMFHGNTKTNVVTLTFVLFVIGSCENSNEILHYYNEHVPNDKKIGSYNDFINKIIGIEGSFDGMRRR